MSCEKRTNTINSTSKTASVCFNIYTRSPNKPFIFRVNSNMVKLKLKYLLYLATLLYYQNALAVWRKVWHRKNEKG